MSIDNEVEAGMYGDFWKIKKILIVHISMVWFELSMMDGVKLVL